MPFNLFARDQTSTVTKDDVVPVQQKESVIMGCESISAGFPAIVPVGSHGHDHRGFTPSDAALVHSVSTDGSAQRGLIETSASAKDNLVATLETRFQTERGIKEAELATERSGRQVERELQSVRQEIVSVIAAESQKTREMLYAQENTRLAVSVSDGKQAALDHKLDAIMKKLLI